MSKFSAKHFLDISAVLATLLIISLQSTLLPLVLADIPLSAYPAAVPIFMQTTRLPLVTGVAELGMVPGDDYPDLYVEYKTRREALLDRITPERKITALVVLNDYYRLELISNIFDASRLNIIGVTSYVSEIHLTMGVGISRGTVPRHSIPAVDSDYRVLEDWGEFYRAADVDGELLELEGRVAQLREQLSILRKGEIPEGSSRGSYQTVEDGQRINLATDPRILKKSPDQRLDNEAFLKWIAKKEEFLSSEETRYRLWSKHLPSSIRIYSVAVQGPANQIGQLRDRPEVALVDPLLFPGLLGGVHEGEGLNKVSFVPTAP